MKKTPLRLLCLLMALLLAGCAADGSPTESAAGTPTVYESIEYVRPDISALSGCIQELDRALYRGDTVERVMDVLDRCYAEYNSFFTMFSVARLRSYQDLTDSYYAAEYDWCYANQYAVDKLFEKLYGVCARSHFAQELEEQYFWEGFTEEYAKGAPSRYTDAALALLDRESELLSSYRALTADPVIHVNGVEHGLYDYLDRTKSDADYYAALSLYYDEYNPALAEIYIGLVRARGELAAEMGYDSYEQMQYEYYFQRDYTPEEANAYLEDIREYIVPLYTSLMQTDPYSSVKYNGLSESELREIFRAVTEVMGGDIEKAFTFMSDGGYYDIGARDNKAKTSFQVYLNNYDAPFLFLDAYGDAEDIITMAHEFGHYADAYVTCNAYETVDASECFSQGMEYLTLEYLGGVIKDSEIENLRLMKLLDTLELYVEQAAYAQFESIVYSADPQKLSEEYLGELSLSLAEEFGFCEAELSNYYADSWSDIYHFFEAPFYIITYPVSNDVAMQLSELETRQTGAGLEKYSEMLEAEHAGLIALIDSAGLSSPFAAGRIQKVAADLAAAATTR